MSEPDARWPTTTPEARLTSAPEKVPVRDSLDAGTRLLDEFEIVRVLGTGGFGIVYLARDHLLQRDVAIKEYMPAALARRGEGDTVAMRASTAGCAETFARGLESFLGEARLLASFDHPALVKVHRFWRGNDTAYMAMPYYPGQTLRDVRLEMAAPPDDAWLTGFIEPLLGALELLHAQGVYHRDIAPDNILIVPGGRPVLLDFGSARRVVANGSRWFTAHLKPQFAPLEQYADEEAAGQGPWTDLYSLGATLYFLVTGRAPAPSVVRAVHDALPALSSAGESSGRRPAHRLLATIDWMLALAPADRPQDVASVRRALAGEITPPPRPKTADADRAAAPSPAPDALPAVGQGDGSAPPERDEPIVAVVPTPLPARRGVGRGAALWLALVGLAAVGWGGATLRDPVPAPSPAAAKAADAPQAVVKTWPPAAPRAEAAAPRADTVSLRLSTSSPPQRPEPDIARNGATVLTEPAVVSVIRVAPQMPAAESSSVRAAQPAFAPRPGARTERGRTMRPRTARSAPAAARTAAARDGSGAHVCSDGSGLLTSTLCVLNPCRDPRARGAQCVDRQRAEAARLRRMEALI